ncbi:cathepsin G [Cricetulus griseus]
MKVTLGAHNIKEKEETQQIIPVAKAIPHPDYNPKDCSNDIMLLKLKRKAKRTKAVRPLKLPRVNAQSLRVFSLYLIRKALLCHPRIPLPTSSPLKQPTWCFLSGKIIGGREARPHSHPYMAFLQIQTPEGLGACGGFLVREDFVMTAAHCWGSSINVTLGAHNIQRPERSQQHVTVLRAIPHPDYDPQTISNDIMLLQLRSRIRKNRVVRPVTLPKATNRVRPGDLCTVAGWGLVSQNRRTNVLQEVRLRVQRDRRCSDRFDTYNSQTQICVGNPRERKSAFRLERQAQLSKAVNIIDLPKSQDLVKPKQVCTVAGWGDLANCTLPNKLQEVKLEVQESDVCRKLSQSYNNSIQLCVGNPKEKKATGEIMWGTEAKPHSHPYMACLKIHTSGSDEPICGGFLVAKDIVMTAAHCYARNLSVILGAHNIKELKNTQIIPVIKAISHERYNSDTKANDIMLLKLKNKAQLNKAVKTIALPKSQDWVKPKQVCTVAGWGKLANGTLPNKLQEVKLEVQESDVCQKLSQSYNNSIQLCVGNPKEKKATGKLERKAQLNKAVKTIALPKSQDWVKPKQVCTVAGWGDLANCTLPNKLQEVKLEVQESDVCQKLSQSYDNTTQLCVGNPKEKKATGKELKNTQPIPVLKVIRHEDYNSEKMVNDIMLLKLKHKAQLNKAVKTIALPKSQEWVKPKQVCTVAGWGKLAGCTLPDKLQEVKLEVQESDVCRKMYKSYDNSTQLCVGNPKEKKATADLQRKAMMTPAVDTVPLPSPSDFIKPGKMCRAAGWGRTGVTEPASDKLREVKLRIMDKEACKYYPNYKYDFQVCVGSPRKIRSAYKIKLAVAASSPSERMHLPALHLLLLLLGSSAKAGEIIGGTECRPHARPYMAYLEIVTPGNHLSACSGFLIRRNFVMTAAHCAGRSITVLLGAHNKKVKEDTWQKLEVEKQFPHPKYDDQLVLNDIMLLKGDSGGPLLCAGIAQGIASYVHWKAKPPAVFTRISHYRPWINKILREN